VPSPTSSFSPPTSPTSSPSTVPPVPVSPPAAAAAHGDTSRLSPAVHVHTSAPVHRHDPPACPV
jgi:hypothetical protein